MDWQPIATAPFEEHVLLYGVQGSQRYCWLGQVWRGPGDIILWDGATAGVTPTHWTRFKPPQ
jgi:hypothetical protein